jgi:hypothetical protein
MRHRIEPGPRTFVDNVIADSKSGAGAAITDDGATFVDLELGPASPRLQDIRAVATAASVPAVAPHTGSHQDSEAHPSSGDMELCRELLDNPRQRRLFVVRNGRDGKVEKVSSIVEHTTRFEYFKITVSQGIVIDPRHPDEATVFALVVNPKDLDRLRDQLRVAVPDLIERPTADPGIVTQLADISQVRACPAAPLAEVLISRDALALRTKSRSDLPAAPAPSDFSPDSERNPAPSSAAEAAHEPEALASSSAPASNRSSGTQGAHAQPNRGIKTKDAPRSDELIVVFVWVCKPPPS